MANSNGHFPEHSVHFSTKHFLLITMHSFYSLELQKLCSSTSSSKNKARDKKLHKQSCTNFLTSEQFQLYSRLLMVHCQGSHKGYMFSRLTFQINLHHKLLFPGLHRSIWATPLHSGSHHVGFSTGMASHGRSDQKVCGVWNTLVLAKKAHPFLVFIQHHHYHLMKVLAIISFIIFLVQDVNLHVVPQVCLVDQRSVCTYIRWPMCEERHNKGSNYVLQVHRFLHLGRAHVMQTALLTAPISRWIGGPNVRSSKWWCGHSSNMTFGDLARVINKVFPCVELTDHKNMCRVIPQRAIFGRDCQCSGALVNCIW